MVFPSLRVGMGALANGLHHSHSNSRSKPHLRPTQQVIAHPILNPLSKARDGTHILMDTIWVHNPLSYNGNAPCASA